jgi:ABC-type sugar transport system permease subunit
MFVLPAVGLFAVFVAYPLLSGAYYSLFRWAGYGEPEFRGFGNYQVLFSDPHFRHALAVTAVYTVAATVLQTFVPMFIAILLTKGFKGSIIFRTMIFIPTTISLTITGLLWRLAFSETGGMVNNALSLLGLDSLNRPWLADGKAVLPIIMLVSLWQSMGYYMLIYYAGLQGLDPALIESAQVDGANAWQQMWRITVPLLRPVTVVVVTLNLLNGVKVYDLIYALTMGGPKRASESLAIYLYSLAFGSENGGRPAFGYADAIGVFLMVAAGILFAVMAKMRKRALDM